MSMDLQVWSRKPFDLPAQLCESGAWTSYPAPSAVRASGESYAYETESWQVEVLTGTAKSNPVPNSIKAISPELLHVAFLTLEPIGADADGYAFLERTVRELARRNDGRWLGPDGLHAYSANEGTL